MTAPTPPATTETDETPPADTSVTPDPDKRVQGLVEARDRYLGERDAALARIAKLQRTEIERLAGISLAHPADVFTLSGNDVADYLDEDGNVDVTRVADDVSAILAERPGMGKLPVATDPTQGLGSPPSKRPPTFGDLLRS